MATKVKTHFTSKSWFLTLFPMSMHSSNSTSNKNCYTNLQYLVCMSTMNQSSIYWVNEDNTCYVKIREKKSLETL